MRMRIFVAMSGGVDSSVVAAILKEQGHDITGVYLKVWSPELENVMGECPWEEDVQAVTAVGRHLDIPTEVWDVSKEYFDNVVEYFFDEYKRGRTPNPDVMCNREMKFGIFLKRALERGADMIATGHYARIIRDPNLRMHPNDPNTNEPREKIIEKELSYTLTGIFFEIQRELGRFSRERQYADALEQKLKERSISYSRELFRDVAGRKSNVLDFLIERRVIIELKAKPFITKDDYYQLSRYLETSNIELGLLVNFRQEYLKPKRVLNARLHAMTFGSFGLDSDHSGRYTLLAGRDKEKDQSYFLYTLNQEQLSKTLFPIGEFTKKEVREMARKYKLPNAERKDSQGVCFIGKIPVKEFLKTRLPEKKGQLVTTEGEVVGEHEGVQYFTIGQRHGIGYPGGGGPYFVTGKDVVTNTLVVAEGEEHPSLFHRELTVHQIHWISGVEPVFPIDCFARIRYRQPLERCTVEEVGDTLRVVFNNPQRAVTPGQAVVFYDGETVFGGGIIS